MLLRTNAVSASVEAGNFAQADLRATCLVDSYHPLAGDLQTACVQS